MAYRIVINTSPSFGSAQERQALIREMDFLRAELDDIRAKYTALRALLVAGTACGAAYGTGTGLVAAQVTPP